MDVYFHMKKGPTFKESYIKDPMNRLTQRYNSFPKGIIPQIQLKIYTTFEDI
jgi:hypothetical protein